MSESSTAHAVDTEFFVRRGMTKGLSLKLLQTPYSLRLTGYQYGSLLTVPLYTGFVLARRGRGAFTLSRLLRATWVGGAVGMLMPSFAKAVHNVA
jgi:hypothetical protein